MCSSSRYVQLCSIFVTLASYFVDWGNKLLLPPLPVEPKGRSSVTITPQLFLDFIVAKKRTTQPMNKTKPGAAATCAVCPILLNLRNSPTTTGSASSRRVTLIWAFSWSSWNRAREFCVTIGAKDEKFPPLLQNLPLNLVLNSKAPSLLLVGLTVRHTGNWSMP